MRSLIIAAAGLLLASCTTESAGDAEPDAVSPRPQTTPPSAAAQAACRADGGEMRRIGMIGTYQCVTPYADAGERCTDGDQCQGDCRAEIDLPPPPSGPPTVPQRTPAPAAPATEGLCQADSNPFGCFAVIEDGRAEPTICAD